MIDYFVLAQGKSNIVNLDFMNIWDAHRLPGMIRLSFTIFLSEVCSSF